jgi:carbon-monoxide dehydrogenase medium subunit
MIPQEFEYTAPQSLRDALALVESGERKILAGGMTLIPMMKLRLATPAEVVDLGRVPGLGGITEAGGALHIGAMTTHHDVETSPVLRAKCPLLAETAGNIGDVQVRNMGTIGGSIAHADPAADYPAALVALEARIRLVSAHSDRTVEASEYFLDAFTTALEPGEIVVEIEVPVEASNEGHRYEKVPHPASGFAVVGIAARIVKSGNRVTMARIGVTGLGPKAFRARNAEAILESGGDIAKAVAVIGDGEDANSDLYASGDYRRHLARVHAARALTVAMSRAS